jgi:hypothetical protein
LLAIIPILCEQSRFRAGKPRAFFELLTKAYEFEIQKYHFGLASFFEGWIRSLPPAWGQKKLHRLRHFFGGLTGSFGAFDGFEREFIRDF